MILLDTHCLIWYLKGDRRLGPRARERIDDERGPDGGAASIAAITLWEIAILVSKDRVSVGQDLGAWFSWLLEDGRMRLLPLGPPVAVDSANLPGSFHGDPSDRLIVATARHHDLPLLTADRAILAYGTEGHVRVVDAAQ
ncbi:type II toxin-antitoxin system VapC family toxin [Aurantimonas sp. C2-6-R+9]|uniref:type II toxin-antitoxin system VapC family toxin n=1 Tax=unclassified Aurantimonas TaxID=2638230 RepID=UPI002E1736C0|nr:MULTISPECIES: type II toxin-antitoxin system VapC family toxin [unclassified Aurantimonas]MEC5291337.1 type II toxin-antitoxin system VapC family toxin [Aurantimonas sp. C2-3-R2]MEC5381543.1 type II toxin-antitoxin system VapC family toxin [Aurantimonas sp. C2-6-R+9]MEC5412424.1 type II toxin-antitoxin system VapC family toxin [Aurantimonas sp. C2-4-R8]